MDFEYIRSTLGDEEKGIVESAVEKARVNRVPEIEKDWRHELKPALETMYGENEAVFHPYEISIETGLPADYVDKCIRHYMDEMEQEEMFFRKEKNGYWVLQRI